MTSLPPACLCSRLLGGKEENGATATTVDASVSSVRMRPLSGLLLFMWGIQHGGRSDPDDGGGAHQNIVAGKGARSALTVASAETAEGGGGQKSDGVQKAGRAGTRRGAEESAGSGASRGPEQWGWRSRAE